MDGTTRLLDIVTTLLVVERAQRGCKPQCEAVRKAIDAIEADRGKPSAARRILESLAMVDGTQTIPAGKRRLTR